MSVPTDRLAALTARLEAQLEQATDLLDRVPELLVAATNVLDWWDSDADHHGEFDRLRTAVGRFGVER